MRLGAAGVATRSTTMALKLVGALLIGLAALSFCAEAGKVEADSDIIPGEYLATFDAQQGNGWQRYLNRPSSGQARMCVRVCCS